MTRDELGELVLRKVAEQCLEVITRPKPKPWEVWALRDDADAREFGPLYSPQWFGEFGRTEARRVRLLRTIYRLAGAGLLEVVKSEGGRLQRVKLTTAGIQAASEIECTAQLN